jgi:hypothetical protein
MGAPLPTAPTPADSAWEAPLSPGGAHQAPHPQPRRQRITRIVHCYVSLNAMARGVVCRRCASGHGQRYRISLILNTPGSHQAAGGARAAAYYTKWSDLAAVNGTHNLGGSRPINKHRVITIWDAVPTDSMDVGRVLRARLDPRRRHPMAAAGISVAHTASARSGQIKWPVGPFSDQDTECIQFIIYEPQFGPL